MSEAREWLIQLVTYKKSTHSNVGVQPFETKPFETKQSRQCLSKCSVLAQGSDGVKYQMHNKDICLATAQTAYTR